MCCRALNSFPSMLGNGEAIEGMAEGLIRLHLAMNYLFFLLSLFASYARTHTHTAHTSVLLPRGDCRGKTIKGPERIGADGKRWSISRVSLGEDS